MLKPASKRSKPKTCLGVAGLGLIRYACALLLALGAAVSHAQTFNLGPKFDQAAQTATDATDPARQDDTIEKVRALLEAAQGELDRVAAAPEEALRAPAGTPTSQLLQRQALLRQLVRIYEQQLDELATLNRIDKQGDVLERQLGKWRLDETRTAFSMQEVEVLRARVQSVLRRIGTHQLNLAAIDAQMEFVFEFSKRFDEYARQLLERIEKHAGEAEQLLWERDFHLRRSQVAAASVDALKTRRKLQEAELALARLELDFLQKQLQKTEGRLEFSEADRIAIIARLDLGLRALDRELEQATIETRKARGHLDKTEASLNQAQARNAAETRPGQRFPLQERLERELELARLRLDTANSRGNAVRLLMSSLDMQRSIWTAWYDIARTRDMATEQRLALGIKGIRDTTGKLYASAEATYLSNLQRLAELERAILVAPEPEDADYLGMQASTLRERAGYQARLLGELLSAKDLLDRWGAEFVSDAGRASTHMSLDEWKRRLAYYADTLWSFELLAAEDTIEVEGRKISTTRSITLGKVVTAILILVVGSLLGRIMIKMACRLSVRYLKTAENETTLAGKWIFALLFVILFVLSLTTVKIPVTVFAFLGGAMAIGIGFGMQTLFKNLISGLMILIERPFRLGDTVEVGEIRGKVVDINLRSSLIRNRDEIETLVPNSTFIEQEVTNWTYSSQRVRYTLQVGVAYGSPTKAVRDLLLDIAKRHKLLLSEPAPEVFFEDFGADALVFSLQYWLDLSGGLDMRRVASDMRFMLDKAFADAGIVIAFPQRDVHLDVGQPIPVRIVRPE